MGTRQRYLLTRASFAGWARQAGSRTVQGVLDKAVESFIGHPVATTGSSRTDAGVHALGATCHVDLVRSNARRPDRPLPPHEPMVVRKAVNHFLEQAGGDVAVRDVCRVPGDLHARFLARKRTRANFSSCTCCCCN
eukprot:SM000195S05270  [mRNA]  locus=s195:152427:153375:+ [translate_table: standard]